MKIPFDISKRPQIESGEYKVVIEYDNRTFYARIVCWDFNSTELLACVNYGDREDVLEYDSSGKHIGKSVGRPDLIIITPEPELSEFEDRLRIICENAVRESQLFPERTSEDFAKKHSAELLNLARKELEPEVLERLEAAYKNQDEVVYENGKRDGKAEALKDLPRWKKCEHEMHTLTNLLIRSIDAMWIGAYVKEGQYYIPTNDLILKLPGFNE